jgi:hypothetical protein
MIYNLRAHDFLVIGVNAADAAKQRENHQASTDKLDLLGIANMLINKRGSLAGGNSRGTASLAGAHPSPQTAGQVEDGNGQPYSSTR